MGVKKEKAGGTAERVRSRNRSPSGGKTGIKLRYVNVNGSFDCQNVRLWSEPDDLALAHGGDEGTVAEFLAGMDV